MAGARRSPPFPAARSWPPRRRGRRRHIPSASAARSSRGRASARTRCAAVRRRIWYCGRPRTYPPRRSWACASPAGNWPPARRGCRGEIFPDRAWRVSVVRYAGSTLAPVLRISICLSATHAAAEVVTRARSGVTLCSVTLEKTEETNMRLKLLSPGEMNADQKETYDEAIAGKRGAAPAPMMAWLGSPQMARHATRLGEQLRFNTIFPAKLSEIAILVTARHWTAHYEWWAHKRLALKGGMDPKIIDDIRDRRTPTFDDPKGRMIYGVSKSLYDEAVTVLTERGVVEVIGLCGYYTMVSMTLNTFEFGLPEGEVSDLA